MSKFICVAKCPELDEDNLKHCLASELTMKEREEKHGEFCPCGNTPIWEEVKD